MILNDTQPIDDDQQWVFVTLTVDGDECQFAHVAPASLVGQDLQDFVDSEESKYKLDILRDMYPDAPLEVRNDFEAFEWWTDSTNTNAFVIPAVLDEHGIEIESERVAEKVPWVNQHPNIIPASGTEKTNLLEAAKNLVDSLTFDDIDSHIETVFSNLNVTQQNSLKNLYKVVLYLAKK